MQPTWIADRPDGVAGVAAACHARPGVRSRTLARSFMIALDVDES
jgi:hypothetical protein